MIGFQSATTSTPTAANKQPVSPSSSPDAANPMRAPSSESPTRSSDSFTPVSSPSLSASSTSSNQHHQHGHNHHLQLLQDNMIQLKRERASSSPPAPSVSLANHISLINQHHNRLQQLQNHRLNHLDGQHHHHHHQQQQHHQQLIKKAPSPPASCKTPNTISSPGYHSAASSPGSSISSPVSSSSGCSSAASSTLGSSGHQHQQQQQAAAAAAAAAAVAVAAVAAVAANSSSLSSSISPASSTSSSRSNATTTTSTTTTTTTTSSHLTLASNVANNSTSNLPNLLDYYPSANHDGLGLTWFHGANNRSRLTSGLMSNKMIIAGDISLAEMSRYPVPIMARPPLGVSDITLENWLQEVGPSQKGIKLTFTSTRTVEPAFRVLARHADQLRGPLVLNADVLARPASAFSGAKQHLQHQDQPQPVDAWTFLMLCRTRFPKSIISIGWCPTRPSQSTSTPTPMGLDQSQQPLGASGGQAGPESMFELDLVMEHQGLAKHQINSLPLVSQLNAVNPHLQRLPSLNHPNRHHHHHHHHNSHHHHLLSSNGSLNSSSGNSSGSPSPTSPVSHLMSPALHHQQLSQHLGQLSQHLGHHRTSQHALDSTEQLILAAAAAEQQQKSPANHQHHHHLHSKSLAWPSLAAMMAVSQANQMIQQQPQQQLPLNLNINEADPQQLAPSTATTASCSSIINHQHQWPHISKKAALSNRLNSNSPSPQSSSPKQFHGQSNNPSASGNLLCVKQTTIPTKSNPNCDNSSQLGYNREMIDKMASLVKEYNLTQPVTFPVEARLLGRSSSSSSSSLCELQRLLYQVGSNSTLTIVAQQEDLIQVDDLLTIRKHFAANQILFDLPDELANSLKQELDLL